MRRVLLSLALAVIAAHAGLAAQSSSLELGDLVSGGGGTRRAAAFHVEGEQ